MTGDVLRKNDEIMLVDGILATKENIVTLLRGSDDVG
jgi:hypothetical protein